MTSHKINQMIKQALLEDAAFNDLTTKILTNPHQKSKAYIIFKEAGVICGLDIAKKVFKTLDRNVRFQSRYKDGQNVPKNTRVAFISGKTKSLLSAERTALNFLAHLSGVATLTKTFVHQIKGTKAKIFDTRKTTPGLRELEKYAVRCGGGENHRINLKKMVLIKDNHLAATTEIPLNEIIKKVRRRTKVPIEIEVTNFSQFKEALKGNPDIILLDNMSFMLIIKIKKYLISLKLKKRPQLEISGGMNLKNIKKAAKTGVERISIGALTHSAKAINLSLEFSHE